jgi:cytochrome P450
MLSTMSHRRLNVPGPRPILGGYGNLLSLIYDPIRTMGWLFDRYGALVNLAHGAPVRMTSPLPKTVGVVFVCGPELLREVATGHSLYHRRQLLGAIAPGSEPGKRQRPLRFFGSGLFDLNDDLHRRHRRLMLPAFHRKRVEGYAAQMIALTERSLARWQPGERRDLHAEMLDLTMRIATSTLFGVDPDGVGARVGRAIKRSLEASFHVVTTLAPFDLPGLPYHRLLNLAAEIESEMRRIIAEKRAQGGSGDDVLAMLLDARDEDDGLQLSEDELVGHAELLFMAGHETSSNALTFTLLLLSQHPALAAALLDELKGELQGAAPTVEQLARLPLLDRVVKESLRILPPVVMNSRVAAEDSQLGGYYIPAGTELHMSIYHTHHLPELYTHPQRFDPARWETNEYSLFAYNPFSGGPRMCIGTSFALMEIKIVLAMLLQRFRLEPIPHTRVDRRIHATMGPRQGLPMLVRTQDGAFERGVGGLRGNIREMVELPL